MGMPGWGIGDRPDIFCRSGRPLRHFDMLKSIPPSRENLAISGSSYKLLSPGRKVTSFKLRQAGIVGALEAGDLGMGIRVHTPRLSYFVSICSVRKFASERERSSS